MTPREFAIDVVRTLREAGHVAYWAGGCVRDELLQRTPKDYDVATSALPDQVREVFGHRHTLNVGAAFGVVMVIGPRSAGTIEVATFRRDAAYSDGRHPDAVTFSDPADDAQRRDFTINGMFFDPLENRVIDYVGGVEDLRLKIIRAIGDPDARIAEDKLRMLRAVRFAANSQFHLDEASLAAIRRHAEEILQVSAERIVGELRLMLTHVHRAAAARLLVQCGLLQVLLPQGQQAYEWIMETGEGNSHWLVITRALEKMQHPEDAAPPFALLLRQLATSHGLGVVRQFGSHWRLSNAEIAAMKFVLRHESIIHSAQQVAWSELQPILIAPLAPALLLYCQALADATGEQQDSVEFCRQKLLLSPDELNPPPLVTGDDLKQMGIPTGPFYRQILESLRVAQLDKTITDSQQAKELAWKLYEELSRLS